MFALPYGRLVRVVLLIGALVGPSAFALAGQDAPKRETESVDPAWCAPELETLAEGVCFSPAPGLKPKGGAERAVGVAPQGAPPEEGVGRGQRALVIFLHSLVTARTKWQWQQQRMLARSGAQNGYSVLIPRGRLGIGPGRDSNTWAWPGAPATQKAYEEEVVSEWMQQKAALEERFGAFDQVFIFGFSNGAYYATSLAMRGRLDVDGYAVFAGGSGSKYHQILGRNTKHRPPIFVGYGTKDPDHPRQVALVRLLDSLHWPERHLGAKVGHMATDAQLEAAIRFLRSAPSAEVLQPSTAGEAPENPAVSE